MGRSRGNFHAEEDPSQRSRRKKNAPSGENLDSVTAGQVTSDGKRALYHCNYCNKDISGRIRIKCAVCSDFDLCIECFSVGAEVYPHKSNHHYRVMDILSFPLICPDWNADEEMLLLEGIEMYGMGNWAEVGEHVGTKAKEACIEHFRTAYLNSPNFPLPDMSHVVGKNRKELLSMARGAGDDKKAAGFSLLGEVTPKDESAFSPSRVKIEDSHKIGPSGRLPSTSVAGTAAKKTLNSGQGMDLPDSLKMEDHSPGKSFTGKNKNSSKEEGNSLMELSGYNAKRQEFDPEYDNDAEQLLADMEFKETDTPDEHELKMRILRIYSKRLDERKRRKDFILERNLLHCSQFEKDLSIEERELCRRYDPFMRYHSKEEHEELLKFVVSEHRTLKRIQELKEARQAGCRSSAEADRYIERKRKTEAENGHRKENSQAGPSSQESLNAAISSDSYGTYSNTRTSSQGNQNEDLSFLAFPGGELLSEPEKHLCREIQLTPSNYLKMQELITLNVFKGNITKKSDAYPYFLIEPVKVDRVYDMLVKKGVVAL